MLPLLALLLIPPTDADAQRRAPAVLIDNFETGTSKWRSNDALAVDRARSTIAAIYAVAGDAPDGGAQAALIEFTAGRNTWASVTTSVDGSTWVDNSCSGLAMWIRGDGPRRRIDLVLRAYTKDADGRAVDTSYTKTVSVSSDEWHALRVPFGAFKAKNGPALDTTALPDVKLLQFVKTGTWQPLRLTVDDFRAVSVVAGRGRLTIGPAETDIAHHDHFGVPAGMTAHLQQVGDEPLVLLDSLIKTVGKA